MGTEQTRTLPRFSKREPLPSNSFCSFDYAHGNESIIYFTDLCKPIKPTSLLGKKKHLQVCSKAHKRNKLAVTDIRQKPVGFFNNTARASTLALAIIFKIQVPSQKFPLLLRYTIPWFIICVIF